jgi:hypothetical protein
VGLRYPRFRRRALPECIALATQLWN